MRNLFGDRLELVAIGTAEPEGMGEGFWRKIAEAMPGVQCMVNVAIVCCVFGSEIGIPLGLVLIPGLDLLGV